MANITVGATAIPLAADGFSVSYQDIGSQERMFDASMLETVRARKQVFACHTPLVTRAAADSYIAALRASPPLGCGGDALNNVSTNCFAKVDGLTPVPTASGLKWRLSFTLSEA